MTLDQGRLRLYLVADAVSGEAGVPEKVAAALRGGVTAVQLRAKAMPDREALGLALDLRDFCDRHGALLLVNDRVDLALLSGADGLHTGEHDIAPRDARRIGGAAMIIGYSPGDVLDTDGREADYLGIGPIYDTLTKADAGAALGIEAFRQRVAEANVPVVGIGGVTAERAPEVLSAGACGVAVVSAIMAAHDPEQAARSLLTSPDRSVARHRRAGPTGSA